MHSPSGEALALGSSGGSQGSFQNLVDGEVGGPGTVAVTSALPKVQGQGSGGEGPQRPEGTRLDAPRPAMPTEDIRRSVDSQKRPREVPESLQTLRDRRP